MSELNAALDQMIEWTKQGRWARNTTYDGNGGMCALGMVAHRIHGNHHFHSGDEFHPVMKALQAAVSEEEIVSLRRGDHLINGGCNYEASRSVFSPRDYGIVTSYSNTRANKEEIISWFERAKEPTLAEMAIARVRRMEESLARSA